MDIISGSYKILQFGSRLAWANFVLFIVYDLIVITGIVIGQGVLKEPYLAIAEVMINALQLLPYLVIDSG